MAWRDPLAKGSPLNFTWSFPADHKGIFKNTVILSESKFDLINDLKTADKGLVMFQRESKECLWGFGGLLAFGVFFI